VRVASTSVLFRSTGTSEPMLENERRTATPAPVWGEYVSHAHCSRKNVVNGVLCAVALVPSIVATWVAYTRCNPLITNKYATAAEACCSVAMGQPIAFANALFFVNVSFGFWIIGLVQRSFWLIDPYWTLIPPLLGHFYQLHPNAHYNAARSAIGLTLLWLWCIRLTHSYFRREEWKFGQREDWRYTKMAGEMPRVWWLVSFFAVGIAQQPMLIGITLPAYTIHFVSSPLGWVDALAIGFSVSGLLVAWVSDNQLRRYMLHNEHLTAQGKLKMKLLNTGMWKFSRRTIPTHCSITAPLDCCVYCARVSPRLSALDVCTPFEPCLHAQPAPRRGAVPPPAHSFLDSTAACADPNYFGEQLWWWAFAGFAAGLGQWYMAGGTLFNSLVLATVTVMTEQRMLSNWPSDRAELYREYMRTTSACVPLPRFPWCAKATMT